MSYKKEYEKWLTSGVLTAEELAELQSIAGDEKEIESRFYGPLEFGTAGLRGTMKMGLHQMNIYVVRWATQGFAEVICAEGEEAKQYKNKLNIKPFVLCYQIFNIVQSFNYCSIYFNSNTIYSLCRVTS